MYQNIGKKIKLMASFVPTILLIVGIIVDIAAFIGHVAIGFIVSLISVVVIGLAYISSWVLYGFGQLVEDTQAIRQEIAGSGSSSSGSPLPPL